MADNEDANNDESDWQSSNPYINEVFRAVPEIGAGKRWYDPPYRVLYSLAFTNFGRRVFPRPVRSQFVRGVNWLHAYNELDRYRAWSLEDPRHTLMVPPDEQVAMPAIWIAEFFPPSQASALKAAIARNNWDDRRFRFASQGETLDSAISESRTGRGWSWLRLGGFRIPGASWYDPEATVRRLPHPFERIEYNLVQIGGGLSVVIGQFIFTPTGQYDLNSVWHTPPEPRIIHRGTDRRVLDRLWGGYAITQQTRQKFHQMAREMVTETMPGSFAAAGQDQPLFDMLLFKGFDPVAISRDEALQDPLRALGISRDLRRLSSPQLPGLLFQETEPRFVPDLNGKRTWTIWGQVAAASSLDRNNVEREEHKPPAIASGGDHGIRDIFVRVATSYFLRLKHAELADSRDRARSQHGKFRRKDTIALRNNILTSSLDTVSMQRDLEMWTKGTGRYTAATLISAMEPWLAARDAERGMPVDEPFDYLDEITKEQSETVEDLVRFDADYREILSTVSSLGSSIYAFKVQRYAITVALISIVLAAIALVPGESWSAVWAWISSAWS